MPPRRAEPGPLPPCYAMVLPGLEEVAAEEISHTLGGQVKRSARGLVVFRVDEISRALLQLRTTEDVYLLAWGTDKLTHRAEDLKKIRAWTAKDVDWDRLLQLHHAIRPKPKGKPTYRLVVQMHGSHVYRRVDAREALAKGLAGKFPASWRHAEENASIEVWLTIDNDTAVCGVRLSDRSMRHRTYKAEHLPASLRPTVAGAMARLAELRPGHVVLDPMCGAGTIVAETLAALRRAGPGPHLVLGGDRERSAVRAAALNLRRLAEPLLVHWDAAWLPLADASVDRVITNPPFGKQLSSPEEIGPLYQDLVRELHRVLRPGGLAVLLVSDLPALKDATAAAGWKSLRRLRVRVLGQPAALTVWRRP